MAPVVVGATPDADDAVAWALGYAGGHGAPVRLVRAYEPGDLWPGGVACALGVPRAGLRDVLARATLTRARRLVRAAGRPTDEEPSIDVVEGRPVDALLAAARGASMVVVGHRPRPAEAVWGFGSVALGVLRHAPTTVTVVRSAAPDGAVVVGMDGTSTARCALRHGLADGAVRGVRTVVVLAGTAVVPAWLHRQVEEAARALRDAGTEPGPVDVVAVEGPPGRALLVVAARQHTSVLVVGHRERGRTAVMMHGSVGQELVAKAPLPVTLVAPDPAVGEHR
ncbi:MAG TPA: universal stress protein [Actinomycetospora sp.]|uniref:universal stress protein n=1 Tax=Actinomycetospora sp. TaxID=1872135 RepID=UPI002F41B47A